MNNLFSNTANNTMVFNESNPSAVRFLRENGNKSIVILGCGRRINRIDNHLRLMVGLNLSYYVGIDYATSIMLAEKDLFMAPDDMNRLLTAYYHGKPDKFLEAIQYFPGTYVEELKGISCAAVVCQRVYPDCRWEEVIISMDPKLVLQEDLHGCERQRLRSRKFVRSWSKIRQFGLKPFRPWPVFPGENNLVLWRRRDFGHEQKRGGKFRWIERLCESFIG